MEDVIVQDSLTPGVAMVVRDCRLLNQIDGTTVALRISEVGRDGLIFLNRVEAERVREAIGNILKDRGA